LMTKIEIFSLTACFRYVFLEKNPLKRSVLLSRRDGVTIPLR